jgi:hypothetical protein
VSVASDSGSIPAARYCAWTSPWSVKRSGKPWMRTAARGSSRARSSSTALPKPPRLAWSSIVTQRPVPRAAAQLLSEANGFAELAATLGAAIAPDLSSPQSPPATSTVRLIPRA